MTLATNLMMEYWKSKQMPTDGLVFHASLNGKTPSTAETGQAINWTGSPSFHVIDGIQCMRHINGTHLMGEAQDNITTAAGWTFSAWVNYSTALGDATWFFGPGMGSWSNMMVFHIDRSNWNTGFTPGGGSPNVLKVINPSTTDRWHHFLGVLVLGSDRKSGSFYFDGVQQTTVTWTGGQYRKNYSLIRLCTDYDTSRRPSYGNYYMAGCRIYNRALSDSEIAQLAHEFTPTT